MGDDACEVGLLPDDNVAGTGIVGLAVLLVEVKCAGEDGVEAIV